MEIRFIKASPGGNITALVESPVPQENRADAAAAVFASDKSVEQLGFLSESRCAEVSLTMAGGEFCGNASLSAAAWFLRKESLPAGKVRVEVSGAVRPVSVELRSLGENEFEGRVDMPLPLEISECEGHPLVRFPGISHLILPYSTPAEEAEAMIIPLCRRLGAEALGLMLYDAEGGRLAPLVYVPEAGSLFWESSCASGSCAVAAWAAAEKGGGVSLRLEQKGGTISVDADYEGALKALRMGGRVRLGEVLSRDFSKI